MAQNEIARLVDIVAQAGTMTFEELKAAAAIPLSQQHMTLLRQRLDFRVKIGPEGERVHTVSVKAGYNGG